MVKRTIHEEGDGRSVSCSLPRKIHPPHHEEEEPTTPHHSFYSSSEEDGTWSSSSTCSSSSYSSFHSLSTSSTSPMNSIGLCQSVLDYIEEMQTFFASLVHVTFKEMSERLKSKCLSSQHHAMTYLQWFIAHKLCVSIPEMAESLMRSISTFICDEDLQDVTITEVVAFLRTIIVNSRTTEESWVIFDVLAHLCTFFKELLVRFKHFVVNLWLYTDRIQRPCEFGKQSDTYFLCMECHQEHR